MKDNSQELLTRSATGMFFQDSANKIDNYFQARHSYKHTVKSLLFFFRASNHLDDIGSVNHLLQVKKNDLDLI